MKILNRRSYTDDAKICGAVVAYGGRVVEFEHLGHRYELKVGRMLYTVKRVFELACDGLTIQVGTGYKSEDEIEKIMLGVVDGHEPVGNISIDENGTVSVSVARGVRHA